MSNLIVKLVVSGIVGVIVVGLIYWKFFMTPEQPPFPPSYGQYPPPGYGPPGYGPPGYGKKNY